MHCDLGVISWNKPFFPQVAFDQCFVIATEKQTGTDSKRTVFQTQFHLETHLGQHRLSTTYEGLVGCPEGGAGHFQL